MATRGRKPVDCYVYVVRVGGVPVYVGKGTGRRYKASARAHGGEGVVVKRFDCEDKAFAYERELIAELMPANNVSPGGNGGRVAPKVLTASERKALREWKATEAEISRVGPRRYCAINLLRMIDERNCERLGISKVGVNRLREVANGPWC